MLALFGMITLGGRPHDSDSAFFNLERAVLCPIAVRAGAVDDEAAVETFTGAKLFLRDLVTDGARDPIGGLTLLGVIGANGEMRENLALLAAELRFIPRDRHVTDGALIFDVRLRFGMIDNLAADASLPVRVAGGVGHHTGAPVKPYGDIGARRADKPVMTGKAAVRGLELR